MGSSSYRKGFFISDLLGGSRWCSWGINGRHFMNSSRLSDGETDRCTSLMTSSDLWTVSLVEKAQLQTHFLWLTLVRSGRYWLFRCTVALFIYASLRALMVVPNQAFFSHLFCPKLVCVQHLPISSKVTDSLIVFIMNKRRKTQNIYYPQSFLA